MLIWEELHNTNDRWPVICFVPSSKKMNERGRVSHPIYGRRVTRQSRVRKKDRNQVQMFRLNPTDFAFGGKQKAWAS